MGLNRERQADVLQVVQRIFNVNRNLLQDLLVFALKSGELLFLRILDLHQPSLFETCGLLLDLLDILKGDLVLFSPSGFN